MLFILIFEHKAVWLENAEMIYDISLFAQYIAKQLCYLVVEVFILVFYPLLNNAAGNFVVIVVKGQEFATVLRNPYVDAVSYTHLLARGLNYYTGAIFEVKALDTPMGSITGGGRYDNLTGIFGLPGLSGVGISFGADRIYDVLGALDLYPKKAVNATQVLFINFGEKETAYCLPIVCLLYTSCISCQAIGT